MNQKEKRELQRRFATLRGTRSYAKFSKDTKISPSLLQRYETGGGVPSMENLLAIACAEKISLSWLMLGKGPMKR